MHASMLSSALSLLMLAGAVAADCSTYSYTSCSDKTVHWYDPNTGEVCDPLDCGGGRAPIKTDVPGCAAYTGTETRTTSYLSCWTPSSALASSTATHAAEITLTGTATASSKTSSATGTNTSGDSTAPETTPAATLSASAQASGTNSTATQTTAANAAGSLAVSLMAVAGVAIGTFMLA
ncbi:Glycoside hydrolase 18 protein [Penicillium macrosclerotiorum]|uniref:Glycoside hydrolase 18 protein n=1 Tax=Penicillium macrosclerotiorum TaxID=303699 RepID=UPI0025488AFB|nr:Glycoside hydrolase 18 protein [Penicillium macrosclerotiorum]KAJ5689218.1 Glycoside hydrolase 18 protein [Penicillium macrosclerotiorum]